MDDSNALEQLNKLSRDLDKVSLLSSNWTLNSWMSALKYSETRTLVIRNQLYESILKVYNISLKIKSRTCSKNSKKAVAVKWVKWVLRKLKRELSNGSSLRAYHGRVVTWEIRKRLITSLQINLRMSWSQMAFCQLSTSLSKQVSRSTYSSFSNKFSCWVRLAILQQPSKISSAKQRSLISQAINSLSK